MGCCDEVADGGCATSPEQKRRLLVAPGTDDGTCYQQCNPMPPPSPAPPPPAPAPPEPTCEDTCYSDDFAGCKTQSPFKPDIGCCTIVLEGGCAADVARRRSLLAVPDLADFDCAIGCFEGMDD
jgi:hypothetical protein